MLKKPNAGWSELSIGQFKREVGNLTDVPCDLIKAFSNFFDYGSGVSSFDCEPYQFDLIFSYTMGVGVAQIAYIADCESEIFCENIKIPDLAKEFIEDIKSNIDAWSKWHGFQDGYSKVDKKYKKKILKGIKRLEKKLQENNNKFKVYVKKS